MIGALLMFYAFYHCKRYGEDKEKINARVNGLRQKGFLNILKESIWALLSPVIVLGCIYAGIASPDRGGSYFCILCPVCKYFYL